MDSSFARASPKVTPPGPRYLEIVTVTGGRLPFIGALVPLVYRASSSAQRSSVIGESTNAVRNRAFSGLAAGPVNVRPFSANRSTGGRLYCPLGPCSEDLNGLTL